MIIDKEIASRITCFLGIDVSKNKLDIAAINRTGEVLVSDIIANKKSDIRTLLNNLNSKITDYHPKNTIFCMEDTGLYCLNLLQVFSDENLLIVKENPYKMKLTFGLIRGKSDKIDAERIALFAMRHVYHLNIWLRPRKPVEELRQINELRNRLVTINKIMQMPMGEKKGLIDEELLLKNIALSKRSTEAIVSDTKKTDHQLDRIIKSDIRLKRLFQIITSVPGVGKYTAIQLLISTNEFLNINEAKKLACYAGVAPFKSESGLKTTRGRVSPHADKKLKSLLHICAIRVLRSDVDLKTYYQKKTDVEKKPKMLVINIIRNKLVKRICRCVTENRLYKK